MSRQASIILLAFGFLVLLIGVALMGEASSLKQQIEIQHALKIPVDSDAEGFKNMIEGFGIAGLIIGAISLFAALISLLLEVLREYFASSRVKQKEQ